MNRYDENYSAYFAAPDEAYPLGSAVDATNEDNLDGTPILAAFFNDVIGFMQATFFGAFGKDAQVSGEPESCIKSNVWSAIQKFVEDKDQVVKDAVAEINGKIPAQASATNQLADKNFVAQKISEIVADSPAAFDTLKEIADWIESHSDSAAAMNSQINENKTNISTLTTKINENKTNISTLTTKTSKLSANGDTYSGNAASAMKLKNARNINGVPFDGTRDITLVVSANATHFGKCPTAAATQAKTVACAGFSLVAGARISVLFANGSTVGSLSGNAVTQASAPTLNVQSTGAKPIKVGNAYAGPNFVNAGEVHDFVYDGSSWNDVTASVIFKGSNSNGNYVKHRDGKIEQSLLAQFSTEKTWTFPIPFSNTNYLVGIEAQSYPNRSYTGIIVQNKTASSCFVTLRFGTGDGGGAGRCWAFSTP